MGLGLRGLALLAAGMGFALGTAAPGRADWWSEHLELHGFVTSKAYARSPSLDLADEVAVSSWRSELNLEAELELHRGPETRAALFGVFRPIYDGVYEIHTDLWGDRAEGGAFDPVTLGAATAGRAKEGETFPGHGACLEGEFCLGNADTGSLFSGKLEPAAIIDDVVFYGVVPAPWRARGNGQAQVGGNATGETYLDFLRGKSNRYVAGAVNPFRVSAAVEQLTAGLLGTGVITNPDVARFIAQTSVNVGTQALERSLTQLASRPLTTPLNSYAGALGNRSSLNEQAPFDLNRYEEDLKFECYDNSHPWCFVRELYAEVESGRTFARIGKQQIVWGKTDAFRLQDNVNPVDLGYHNVFPELEERRIPQLALDVIHSFGELGPLQDVSLEFAWVFDRFRPVQFGQCGEPYAYTAACQARADAGAHSLFNFALAAVDEVPWTFENTEPGVRLEFRTPRPSVAFSFSAFFGHQDLPVGSFENLYSVDNPNTGPMLFLQGLGAMPLLAPTFGPPGTSSGPWSSGFDPFDRSGLQGGAPGSPPGGLAQANQILLATWRGLFDADGPCGGVVFDGEALGRCVTPFQALTLPWTASEAVIEYPRVLTLGGSADYQIPRSDTILRLEMAYDVDRGFNDTSEPDGFDSSDVFLASIGVDRPTYIPFLNPTRTAFLTFQTFVEHVIDYDDEGFGDGFVAPETQVISTFLMQNYWRNDSLVLTNFVAYDWNAGALIAGPSFRWVMSNNLFLDFGVNLLFGGRDQRHNIRDLCPDGRIELEPGEDPDTACWIGNPEAWNPGQWQMLNEGAQRFARAPWWARQSFADDLQEDRDEFWVGVTYQF